MRVPIAEITDARISRLDLTDHTLSRSARQDVMRWSGIGHPYFTGMRYPRATVARRIFATLCGGRAATSMPNPGRQRDGAIVAK
jgi:hypothetical protein